VDQSPEVSAGAGGPGDFHARKRSVAAHDQNTANCSNRAAWPIPVTHGRLSRLGRLGRRGWLGWFGWFGWFG
jgi:hypothetical protein